MKRKWWHDKVAYQIYPKSFLDTNGDGIGDLKGIISKLDYLKELGIDIIWLSPVYESPFVDQGYDISDYYKIAEQFGTMDDFDTLVAEMKKRGMHLIMDLVVNHCSDKHEWFQKALADPDGPYAGYFYFREGKDGKAPSNYRSNFGGSAWTKIPGTNKYYLHTFAKEQPDLNWENPIVRKKIYEMINWWFEKGISGFRIDAIINIKKNLDFPSFPADGGDGLVSCDKMLASAHGIGTFLEEMKHETFDKYDAFTVGEVFHLKEDELREFIGEDGHFSTKFDFSAHVLSYGEHGWYDAPALDFNRWRTALFDTQKADLTVGFEANIIENHDEPRGATHYLPAHARNEAGVKMEFYEDNDEVISIWRPRPEYQGWIDTLHGGIQAVLLDEICAWVILRKLQTTGVTSKMETRYRKSISTNDSHVVLKAHIKEVKRNIVIIEARLYNKDEELCTETLCTYFTFPKEKAREEMHFLSCEVEDEEILPLI